MSDHSDIANLSQTAGRGGILMVAVTPYFYDRGCHIRIYSEIKFLNNHGQSVTLCTYPGPDVPKNQTLSNARVVRTFNPSFFIGATKAGPGWSWRKIILDPLLTWTVWKEIRKKKPAIIHAHLYEGLLAAALARRLAGSRAPIVFDCQGSLTEEIDRYHFANHSHFWRPFRYLANLLRRPILSLFRFIERTLLFLPDTIVASSDVCAAILISTFSIPPKKITVISDGYDPDFFSPAQLDEKALLKSGFGIPAEKKLIIYAGLISAGKGAEEYLEAIPALAKGMPDTVFLFAGYGDLVSKYQKKYAALIESGQLIFTGRISYFEIGALIRAADLAIDPKPPSSESSAKLLNYLASGLPVLSRTIPLSGLADFAVPFKSFQEIPGLSKEIISGIGSSAAPAFTSSPKPAQKLPLEWSWPALVSRLLAVYGDLRI